MKKLAFVLCSLVLFLPRPAHAEVILQWFETPWREIEARMPEVALAGYQALWLPPPTKGADGAFDVGFALYDRFDLGNLDQRGSIPTRYGTLLELRSMVDTAHRFGIRVYFDTVMNHNSNPARVEFAGGLPTPPSMLDYPGMTPLDFHVWPARQTGVPGEYEAKAPAEFGGAIWKLRPYVSGQSCPSTSPPTICEDDSVPAAPLSMIPAAQLPPGGLNHPALTGWTHLVRAPRMTFGNLSGQNWCLPGDRANGCAFELQNASLLGLVDIANEQWANTAGPLTRDGTNNVTGTPLISYIRNPDRVDTYPNSTPVAEDPRQYLMRWIRWISDVTDADGFRLDAIRHTPESFFAEDYPGDPVAFVKAIQDSYDARRGNTDENDDDGVDDAAIFGESFTGDIFGELQSYRNTGMRLLNFPLFFGMRGAFSGNRGTGTGGDTTGDLGAVTFPRPADAQLGSLQEFGGLGRHDGVSFIQSHDECPPGTPVRDVPNCVPQSFTQDDLAQAFIIHRVGDSVVYFDGNNFTESTFVRAGRPDALGDLSANIPHTVRAAEDASRGGQFNRFVDHDAYVFERISDGFGPTALIALHDSTNLQNLDDNMGRAAFGGFDPRPLVVTAFPPGTLLVELTGNAPAGAETVTVLDPATESQQARDNAYAAHKAANGGDTFLPPGHGLVYFKIPGGQTGNYLVFAPASAVEESAAISILEGGTAATTRNVETTTSKTTNLGLAVPAPSIQEAVCGPNITVRVPVTTAAGAVAGVMVDALAGPGVPVLSSTPEGLADGMGTMAVQGSAFEANLTGLSAGRHLVRVRVVTPVTGAAPRLKTLRMFINVTASMTLDGGVVMDAATFTDDASVATPDAGGGMDAAGSPDATVVVQDAGVADAAVASDGSVAPADAGPQQDGSVDAGGGGDDGDHDGVPSSRDNCPTISNADQADFDRDMVGNACDLCPDEGTAPVDSSGCKTLAPEAQAKLQRLMEMVVGIVQPDLALDEDGNGTLDAVDVARAVRRARGQ